MALSVQQRQPETQFSLTKKSNYPSSQPLRQRTACKQAVGNAGQALQAAHIPARAPSHASHFRLPNHPLTRYLCHCYFGLPSNQKAA
ncbi:hypothetical protein [Kingella sp. (in: b-proteobacteria)]|uniref:hypothetical protein n=1 Tax=Kingella sp. (in: b-proteobacteria) TaxID=2020713 RepID=UPI0026DB89D9|nr:hypothetical protein [Kingella sp. (in: b-proteobacteria)]MDO4656472.1 hypothetical protein [Kingella sp. (in: b-proteobacteria)]